jgi:hypothetical protein
VRVVAFLFPPIDEKDGWIMADVTQPWGLVHGRINVAVGDSTDAGRAPDKVPVASGLATFTATIDKLVTTTPGQESIDLPQKIVASISERCVAVGWHRRRVPDRVGR